MNASERIAEWLLQQGVDQVFTVTGGGAMYLNQALGRKAGMTCTFMHHEQACAMAAEGYARITGKPAVVMLTTGPGAINAMNGVFGAYTDSIPMIVISGQVKRATCLDYNPVPGLRQLGDQEGPIVAMARPITKLASTVDGTESLSDLLPRALLSATTGRPGPVWLDIPLDVQSAECPPLPPLGELREAPPDKSLVSTCSKVFDLLREAHRPLILAGTGVRLAKAQELLLQFATAHGIPVATAWTHDLIASDHPLFAGRPGTIGTRAGNFCLQSADLVIVIGSRLNIRQASYNWDSFAKQARLIHVDIDQAELEKPLVKSDIAIAADAKVFLTGLIAACRPGLPDFSPWVEWCHEVRSRHPVQVEQPSGALIHPYAFVSHVFDLLDEDDIVVCGNASACILPFQVGKLKAGNRMFSNSGSASMGYDLPAAIGAACAAAGRRRVICFAGDGSLQMNIQELQTLKNLWPDLIVIVIDNGGYLSIRQTHENFFGCIVGANPDSGVDFPDFCAVAQAYGIPSFSVTDWHEITVLDQVFGMRGPRLVSVRVDPQVGFEPRIKSRAIPGGGFATPELDDMYPFLPSEEINSVRESARKIQARSR